MNSVQARSGSQQQLELDNGAALSDAGTQEAFACLDVDWNGCGPAVAPARLFMGFGYNPDLASFGERLDILSFYSWMRRLQQKLSVGWVVYDASGYYIVNKLPQKRLERLGPRPTARQILDALVSEQERSRRQEIARNCELRSRYLRKLIGVSGIDAAYVDSREAFREGSGYERALETSLEFAERLQRDDPELVGRIMPPAKNPASRLYLPLEMAEALYLEGELGVGGKFGPKTEENFDRTIMGLTGWRGIPYMAARCPAGPRRPAYLSDRRVIWAVSPDTFVREILGSDGEYRTFVSQYLEPFRGDGETVEECALRMRKEMSLEAL